MSYLGDIERQLDAMAMAIPIPRVTTSLIEVVLSDLNSSGYEARVETINPGDYVTFYIRKRGVREMHTWRVANTMMAVMDVWQLSRKLRELADKGTLPQDKDIRPEPTKERSPMDVWVDNWSKANKKANKKANS